MRMLVIRALQQAGFAFDVVEAGDGREALAHVRQECPHLIIADWDMPVMNGIELLREIRSSGIRIPFGFVTAQSTAKSREEALMAGANFFVSKPFTPDSFIEAIHGVL